ncbi:hypothetical protein C8R43DRAFT_1239225 [Mycena crocata]|nr:hypothetical protein C8R43DRAFT_1239225 [Mycena crocata]
MPICHLHRACAVQRPISPQSQPIFLQALSLRRPRSTLRQSRFVRSFMIKKEGILHSRKQVTAHVRALRTHKPVRPAQLTGSCVSDVSSPVFPSISERRLGHNVQTRLSFTVYREFPPLAAKTPLPNLITPSKFPSPFTPVNQVLYTPFHPPEPHKATPSKRHRNPNWQWSPVARLRSPGAGFDENSPPMRTPATPDSPVCNLARRLSLIAPPTSSKHVPRRLSYSHHSCVSPWTPDSRHGQALASPVLIRPTLWTPASPVASPRYQLDDLHFSPFHVPSF